MPIWFMICPGKYIESRYSVCPHSSMVKHSEIDHCLHTKQVKDGSLLILILYVDNMLIATFDRYFDIEVKDGKIF